MFLNNIFENKVSVAADAIFDNCEFKVRGTSKKDANTPGIIVTGSANLTVKNSKFNTTGYQAINIQTSGIVNIENNVINCVNNYNPIEGTVTDGSAVDKVNIKNNTFVGQCGNNYINFYKMAENAVITIDNNDIESANPDSEVVRISNPSNVNVTFNMSGNRYHYSSDVANDWTAFIMCQDYSKQGESQDFTKVKINISDLFCNGKKVESKDEAPQGKLYFVYDNQDGIITGQNDPVITVQ